MQQGLRMALTGFCVAMLGGLTACSDGGSSAGDLLGLDSDASESSVLASSSSGPGSGNEIRVEARLDPVIAVDASGHARSEDKAGTREDRFDAEVEIDKDDFTRLGIDAGDGFADEVVRLTVTRNGAQVFATNLRFSENRGEDITFEADIRGGPAPELRAGDFGRVRVNGTLTLRGTFQRK